MIGKVGAVLTGIVKVCCGGGGVFGGESAAGEGGVSEDADLMLSAPGENSGFGLAREEIVGELERFNAGDLGGLLEQFERKVGDAEVLELALTVEFGERVESFVHGSARVGPVDLKERDGVDLETAKAVVHGLGDCGGAEVAMDAMLIIPEKAAFGGDDGVGAVRAESVSEKLLGVAEAVDVGHVKEIDATIESFVDGGAPFLLVDGTVIVAGGRPAAEADARDLQVGLAEAVIFDDLFQLAPRNHEF